MEFNSFQIQNQLDYDQPKIGTDNEENLKKFKT